MIKVAFITKSENIHSYLWNCINNLLNREEKVSVSIYVDNSVNSLNFEFSSIIKLIDKRFSSFKNDPFEIKSINIFQQHPNFKLIKEFSDFEIYDWIIVENTNLNLGEYIKYSKNGFLNLKIPKKLSSIIFNNNDLELIIVSYHSNGSWKIADKTILKKQLGITNNLNKLLFYYSIFLSKFLLKENSNQKNVFNNLNNEKKTFLNIKFIFYYLSLIKLIIIRKLIKKKLNWKIGVKKNNDIFMLNQPKDSFWADPFILHENNKTVIFFEELINNVGKISCAITDENFNIEDKKVILDEHYHLSFPNVFLFNNNYYMIPESSANRTLKLYKCKSFPFYWEYSMDLFNDIKLVDAIWVFHDDMYWIFANKIEDFEYDNNENLYLYYSKNLLSNEWTSHKNNPVITSYSSARNAGNFIRKDSKIYRVSQNSTVGYGDNIVINEVLELSIKNYSEKRIESLYPPKNYVGKHTLNSFDNIFVFDYLKEE